MSTLTPSGLIKPDYTDPASVNPINDNSDRIDTYGLGAYAISGDTFPPDPWEGMKVYKQDFHELYVYSTLGGAVAGQWWLLGAGRKINYTPVINNITLGSGGVIEGQYFRVGHNALPSAVAIYYRVHLAIGVGGDVTGTINFGLPGVPEMWSAAGTDLMKQVGHAVCATTPTPGGAVIPGVVICTNSTAVGSAGETQQIVTVTPDSTLLGTLWNASIPIDWTNISNMWVQGWYWPDQNGVSWGI